jgi:hypothetical protein
VIWKNRSSREGVVVVDDVVMDPPEAVDAGLRRIQNVRTGVTSSTMI